MEAQNTSVSPKKKTSLVPYLIAGAGLLAFILLSSFKKGTGDAQAQPLSPCGSNKNCLNGFWRWAIRRDPTYLKSIVDKVGNSDMAIREEIKKHADWMVENKGTYLESEMAKFTSLVDQQMDIVTNKNPGILPENARLVAIEDMLS